MINLFYVLLIVVFIVLILIFFAPKEFSVQRSIVINKSLPEVFQYLKFVKNKNDWSPWMKKDVTMKHEYFGVDGEVGFISKWKGHKSMGLGEQEIVRIVDNEVIETQLRFFKPYKSQSSTFVKVAFLKDKKTSVTWGCSGNCKIPINVLFLVCSMDKAVGKDFEIGLNNLKKIVEM